MMRWNPWIGCLLAATAGLVGCAPKTNVSTTANVPAAYSHVYLSVQEVWFNTSATAGPDDTTWKKFPLTTPTTVDLASSLEGTVTSLTTGLAVPIGTYAQVRLIPVSSATVLDSAANLGAIYNSEVDYTDSAGLHRLPLELLNPDKGLGVTTTVQVKGDTTNVFSSTSNSTSNSSTSNSNIDPNTGLPVSNTTTDPTTGQPVNNSTTDTSTTNTTNTNTGTTPAATFELAIAVDGSKDLVPFTYSDVSAMMLNSHIVAYDQAAAGGITGTLDVSSLTGVTSPSTSSYLNIQVTAESVSADGSRHIAVNSAPVTSSGTFTIYPLSTSSSSPTSYDLVIHGPGIATIIVKGVTVNVGDPATTTPVNIGSITPQGASSFTVNLDTTNPLQAGALVGFYQTLPGSSEVPYLIDSQPIDPFTRKFNADVAESSGTLYYGTFASGSTVTLTSADPTEGAATYRVAGTAPLFTDGVLTTTVKAPSASSTTATTLVAVPQLTAASGAALDSTSVTISKSSSTKYNKGELIFSHDGAVVQTVALDSILTQTANATLTVSGLPGGGATGTFNDGLYDVSVRVWNTSNAASTLAREIYPTPLNLRTGAVSSYQLNIE
jgi:hypothetical protein